MINIKMYSIHLRIQKIENLQNVEKTGIKFFSCTREKPIEQGLTLNQNKIFIIEAKIQTKTYSNCEQTRVKIPKPERNLPCNLKQFYKFKLQDQVFAINYVLAGLIPVILMNIENAAQWLEHFRLKHRLPIVEC